MLQLNLEVEEVLTKPRTGVKIRYQGLPTLRRISELAGDLDRVPPLTRRHNGRIQSICGIGVLEFCKLAGITHDSYYRLVSRKNGPNDEHCVRYMTLEKIVRTMNLLYGDVRVDVRWVLDNFLTLPYTPGCDNQVIYQNITNRQKYRGAIKALNVNMAALQIHARHNLGTIEKIVERRAVMPLDVRAVIHDAHKIATGAILENPGVSPEALARLREEEAEEEVRSRGVLVSEQPRKVRSLDDLLRDA
jgi:hypothetical protein